MTRKSFTFLIAIGVCALMTISAAAAQKLTSFPADFAEIVIVPPISHDVQDSPNAQVDGIQNKLADAKRLLQSRADLSAGKTVSLAILDPQTSQLHLATVNKDSFLTKDATLSATLESGARVQVDIVRANGVNTAVKVEGEDGRALTPLMIAFPIVKGGKVTETAYYTSAHPALMSDDLTSGGETYVSAKLDEAAHNLAAKGVHVPADIVQIAAHLCVVEHTDHKRFMTEDHTTLFPEILSLYALNQGDTFRYSVSTAGAGGMIQMIPRTYQGIRQDHANVSLQTDFVDGMRNHANALEAMLLYMNDTWNKLQQSSDVQDALKSGIATKPELLAAGYNSNPGRLPSYLKTGGANWRTLIPAETQMYLAIYSEVDQHVKFNDAASSSNATDHALAVAGTAPATGMMGWIGTFLGRIF